MLTGMANAYLDEVSPKSVEQEYLNVVSLLYP